MKNFTFDMAAEWMSLTQELPAKTRIALFDALTHYAATGEMPQMNVKDLFIFKMLFKIVVADAGTNTADSTTNSTATTNTTTTTIKENYIKEKCSSSNEVKKVVAESVPAQAAPAQAPYAPAQAAPAQAQAAQVQAAPATPATPAQAPCTEAELAAYFTACNLPNAKDQAHQCFAYNEARGWMQGGRRVTTRDGWHWIAQCWIRQAAKHPAPPKAPLTDDEMAENRRKKAEEDAKINARMEIESHWNDVRNIVCLAHKDEYMDIFHPIRIVNETAEKVLISIPDNIVSRLTAEPFRTTLLNAVKQVYGNKQLTVCKG